MKKLGLLVTLLAIMMVFFVGCAGSESGSDMSLEQQERILMEIMLAFEESGEPDSYTETNASFDFVVADGYDASFESDIGTTPRYIGEGSRIIAEMSLTGTTTSEMTPPFSISMELRAIDDRLPGGEVEVVINVSVTSETSMSVSARMNGDLIADELLEDLDFF